MGIVRVRNVTTGEIRDMESQSDEYAELINEVYDHDGSARPKWENTGEHHVRRVDSDEIQEADLGYKFKPVPGSQVGIEEIGPEPHPERALTQGEVDSGVESYEEKMKDLSIQDVNANPALTNAEPLERVESGKRLEEGRKAAGSTGSGRKRSSKSSGSSGSGSSGSSSGPSSSSGSGSGSSVSGGSSS